MPKKRTANHHWPPRWSEKHGSIYYQPPKDQRHLWDGKTWFRLGRSEPEAWATWYARMKPAGDKPRLISEAIDRYCAEDLPKLADKTRTEYTRSFSKLRPVFGHMPIGALKPHHVYGYLDKRPATAGNRDKAALSSVMTAAVRWGCIDRNLVREVRRNTETPRDRYVDDHELQAFLGHCNPMLQAYVTLRMLTGLRQGQLLDLRRSYWDSDKATLTVPGAKRGRTVRYQGDGLKEAVEAVLALQEGVKSMHLLCSRNGTRYTQHGFGAIFRRAMAKHVAAGGEHFRENDLRAKVASDSETVSDARDRLGHQTEATTQRVYRRKPVAAKVLPFNASSKTTNTKTASGKRRKTAAK